MLLRKYVFPGLLGAAAAGQLGLKTPHRSRSIRSLLGAQSPRGANPKESSDLPIGIVSFLRGKLYAASKCILYPKVRQYRRSQLAAKVPFNFSAISMTSS
jgi:hypothetical protein